MAAAAIPLILTGLSGLAGFFGNKAKKQEQTSTTNSSQQTNQNFTGTSTPNLSSNQQQLSDLFTSGAINKYLKGTDMSGITAGGLKQINQGADMKQIALRNSLASRGLSYSPYAGVVSAAQDSSRIGDSVNFLDQIPMLQRQLQSDDLGDLIKSFGALPTATTTSGTSSGTTTGTSTQKGTGLVGGSPWAGALEGAGSALALPGAGGSNLASIMKSLFGFGK